MKSMLMMNSIPTDPLNQHLQKFLLSTKCLDLLNHCGTKEQDIQLSSKNEWPKNKILAFLLRIVIKRRVLFVALPNAEQASYDCTAINGEEITKPWTICVATFYIYGCSFRNHLDIWRFTVTMFSLMIGGWNRRLIFLQIIILREAGIIFVKSIEKSSKICDKFLWFLFWKSLINEEIELRDLKKKHKKEL